MSIVPCRKIARQSKHQEGNSNRSFQVSSILFTASICILLVIFSSIYSSFVTLPNKEERFGYNLNNQASENKDQSTPNIMSLAKDFVIKPSGKAAASIIFLHGLGDNGAGWYQGFKEIKSPQVRYVFPNAPSIPVTLNMGMVMPSWFDLKGLRPDADEDEQGIKQAAEKLRMLIESEMAEHGLSSNQIMIGGFSQGGALALYTALTHKKPLGGVIALSSWLPLHRKFKDDSNAEYSLTNQGCSIFQAHGGADMMVPTQFGIMTNELLKVNKNRVATFKVYQGMGHESSLDEMVDLKKFIDETFKH